MDIINHQIGNPSMLQFYDNEQQLSSLAVEERTVYLYDYKKRMDDEYAKLDKLRKHQAEEKKYITRAPVYRRAWKNYSKLGNDIVSYEEDKEIEEALYKIALEDSKQESQDTFSNIYIEQPLPTSPVFSCGAASSSKPPLLEPPSPPPQLPKKYKKDKVYYIVDQTKKLNFNKIKWKSIVELTKNDDIKTIYYEKLPYIPEDKRPTMCRIKSSVILHRE